MRPARDASAVVRRVRPAAPGGGVGPRRRSARPLCAALAAMVAVAGLAGCGGGLRTVATAPDGIALRGVGNYTLAAATVTALEHCRAYGRTAVLVPDSVANGRATYRCVDG